LLIGTAIAFFSGRLAKSTELIEKANGQQFMTKAPKIVLPPISDAKSDQRRRKDGLFTAMTATSSAGKISNWILHQ